MQISEFEHPSHVVVCTIITDELISVLDFGLHSCCQIKHGTALSTDTVVICTFSTAVLISVLKFGLHSCCPINSQFLTETAVQLYRSSWKHGQEFHPMYVNVLFMSMNFVKLQNKCIFLRFL